MSRAKNPKYESMSLEELKANMEKSRQELEAAIHHKNILEQRKKLVERRERSHRLIVKGAEFEKVFPLSRDLEQEDVQDMMNQLQNSSYNKSIVRQAHIAACIFRKNCASVPEERSAIPLQTEQSSAG